MDVISLILLVFLAYSNSVRAKLKGKKPLLWAFITVGAYFAAFIFGGMLVIFNFCKDTINFSQFSSLDPKSKQAVQDQMQAALTANPLHVLTIYLAGFGGYLLVRYIIDRTPDKKKPEVHWMDKMGEQ